MVLLVFFCTSTLQILPYKEGSAHCYMRRQSHQGLLLQEIWPLCNFFKCSPKCTLFKDSQVVLSSRTSAASNILSNLAHRPWQLNQLKRLQRVQNVCAGFVNGCYGHEEDYLKLGCIWLPIIERMKLELINATFKALYFEHWPDYVKLEKYIPTRTLRSSSETKLKVPLTKGTFKDSAAETFNCLPATIGNCKNFTIFQREVRAHLGNMASIRLNG